MNDAIAEIRKFFCIMKTVKTIRNHFSLSNRQFDENILLKIVQ